MKTKILTLTAITGMLAFTYSCKKSGTGVPEPNGPDTTVVIQPAIDPPLASTIGFFLDDWQPVNFTSPTTFANGTVPSASGTTITIDRSSVITKIPRSLFGNNSNTWMTQIVTEAPLMDHINTLHPHIIRFPGGSISDVFFWNAPANTPPADAPANLVNASGVSAASGFWFGKNADNWTLSLDNYYSLLQQTGNQGLITINYGYARYGKAANPVAAAAHLAADWVRYDNGRTKYWEIGNENFGDWEAGYRINTADNLDGQPQILTGQLYGQHFKVFADSMRKAATELGKTIQIGAVTVEATPPAWGTQTLQTWNAGLLSAATNVPDYYVIHSYYTPFNTNSNATDVLNSALTETKKMIEYVKTTLQNAGASIKPVAMDEWNIFATGSKQQVSHINGLHSDLVIGEIIENKFGMASRWDLANAWANGDDHGMFNNGDEPDLVPKWNPRPAFYHQYFHKKYLGDRSVSSTSTSAELESYASSFSSGEVGVVLVNKSANDKPVEIKVNNFRKGNRYYWYTLSGDNDNGEFSRKVLVNGSGPAFASGGPANYKTIQPYSASATGAIRVTVPARSAVFMAIDKK